MSRKQRQRRAGHRQSSTIEVSVYLLGGCVAAVDPRTGIGLLALPHPELDVAFPGSDGYTLAQAELCAALADLDSLGIEALDETGESDAPDLGTGRPVIELWSRERTLTDRDEILANVADAVKACRHALESITAE